MLHLDYGVVLCSNCMPDNLIKFYLRNRRVNEEIK